MLNVMLRNWWTTLLGLVTGSAFWVAAVGAEVPTTLEGWAKALVAVALAVAGFVQKDAVVGSVPVGTEPQGPAVEPPSAPRR